MKKFLTAGAAVLALISLFSSCSKQIVEKTIDVLDSKVVLSSTQLSLMETETAYLIATCYGDAKDEVVEWSTSSRSIATVSNTGKVTALSNGTATITATAGKYSASCTVTVKAYDESVVPVVKIDVDPAEVTIVETRTATVTAIYLPSNATEQPQFEWSSEDESVATVNGGIVTAVKEGRTRIAIKGGDHYAYCTVIVIPDNNPTTKIELNKTDFRLGKDFEEQLEVIYTPSDHTDLAEVTWVSSNPSVATVSNSGLVKGIAAGEATITATFKSLTATCHVTVFAPKITKAWNGEGSRAYPILKNPGVLNNLSAFTMEALVMARDWKVSGSLSTIMGVEGIFLIRVGDAGIPSNRLQVATNSGNLALPAAYDFEAGKWYHVAVTYSYTSRTNRSLNVYVNGELASSSTSVGTNAKSFGMTHTNEADGTRVFWVGYAYDNARDLRGGLSEVRIWNRVLSSEEINAEDHFYEVDPASSGLVAYWKMNDGEGSVIKDYTSNGNDLQSEVGIDKVNNTWTGTNGANWLDVALPE